MTPIRGWCCGKTLSSTIFWVQLWASVMLRGDVLGQKGRWSTWDTLGVYWRRNSTTCKHIRAYTCACVSEFALITRELKIPFLFTFLFLLPIRPRRRCLRVQIHLTVKADLSVAPAANGRKVEITQRWPNSAAMSSDAAAAAELLQSCPTLCDPIDGSPPGSAIPGILQARTLEWVAISFSNAWKWKVKVKSLSRVRLLATSWTAAYQAPSSMGFSRQEYWSGVPCNLLWWWVKA